MSERCLITPGHRGAGGGLAPGTRLATPRGLIPVEAVVPGDAVSLADGPYAPVTSIKLQGPRPAVRLRVQGGYALVIGSAQPLAVLDAMGAFVWRPAADLRPGDVLVLQPGRGLPPDLSAVPLPPCPSPYGHTHKTLITPAVADEELACFVGYAVGNGTLSVTSRLSWTVNLRDQAFAAAFNADAERRFGIPVRPAR